jgi:hypothetical protein
VRCIALLECTVDNSVDITELPGCAVGRHPAHACTCGVPVLRRDHQSNLLKMKALNAAPPAGTRSAAAARARAGGRALRWCYDGVEVQGKGSTPTRMGS